MHKSNVTGGLCLKQDEQVYLPTEAQWERAARWTDGRKYPWGNEKPTIQLANYYDSKINAPTPVGIYPSGATPEGIQDLAGNVWEWCSDWYKDDYYQQKSRRSNPDGPAEGDYRVLRGGSFVRESRFLRGAFRCRFQPEFRNRDCGFRCVLCPRRQP